MAGISPVLSKKYTYVGLFDALEPRWIKSLAVCTPEWVADVDS